MGEAMGYLVGKGLKERERERRGGREYWWGIGG